MIEFEPENRSARKESNVLIEKYRPLTVKHVLLPNRFKRYFLSFVEEQEIHNIIIHSNSPGSGKTTIAKALANDCNYEYKYINTSLHGGIDTLRSEIVEFASVKTFDGRRKVVILDEFDGASRNLQDALRGAIEEFYDKCRFILTANSLNKIIKPLHSRCTPINFDFTEQDKIQLGARIATRLETIAEKEDIDFEEGVMTKIVDTFYPDIRKMINVISEYSRQYGVINENIFKFDMIDDELKNLIFDLNIKKVRRYILDNNFKHDDLYRYVFDRVIPECDDSIKGNLYILTSQYIELSSRSWDQEITFTAFLVEMMQLIREA